MTLLPEQPGRPAPSDLLERRGQIAAAAAAGVWQTDPPAEDIVMGGVRALRFRPLGPSRALMVHFHGGAYRLGAPEAVGPYAAALAARARVTVICPAYRLAPEYPCPAAILDGLSVTRELVQSRSCPFLIAGDSAGGGLAASLTRLAVAEGLVPAGLVLLSAWLDLTVTSASFQKNAATDPLFSHAAASEAAALYLGDLPADNPLASPLLGSVASFPPTLISVGGGEVLLDDARAFHAKLRTAGRDSSLAVIAGMDHVAVTRSLSLNGSAETFEAISTFIDAVLEWKPVCLPTSNA